MSRAKNWRFTMYDTDQLLDWSLYEEKARYLIYSREKCPTTGREHFQGFISFHDAQRLTAIQKLPRFKGPNWGICRGTVAQNIAYCSKPESHIEGPWIHGEQPPEKGARMDLKPAADLLKETKSLKRVAEEFPTEYIKFHRGFEAYHRKVSPSVEVPKFSPEQFNIPAQDLTKTLVIYGGSGFGKTEYAISHFKSPLFIRHLDKLGEFDPSTHDGIVFDDMSFLHHPMEARIHLVDMDRDSDINIRYAVAKIPRGTKRIFTHNNREVFYDTLAIGKQVDAINRRVNFFEVNKILF